MLRTWIDKDINDKNLNQKDLLIERIRDEILNSPFFEQNTPT